MTFSPPPLDQARDDLLALLVRRSYRRSAQGFTLTSGRRSHHYVDCKQTTLDPHGAYLCGLLLFERLKGRGIGTVGGLTLGADPLVSAVAVISHQMGEPMTAAIVRKVAKGHGTGQWIEGPADPALPVAVVDDVVTTGKSTGTAIDRMREAGFKVACVLAVVDRNEGGREAVEQRGLALEALFTMDDILTHRNAQP